MSNGLDPDQDGYYVGPDLGPNCLPRLSADNNELTVKVVRNEIKPNVPGCVGQSVRCLATDASLTADPGVASLIQARSHTFVEIDYEIISMVILLPSAESFKDCCQLQAKVCARSTG